jgi:hypothetical protein
MRRVISEAIIIWIVDLLSKGKTKEDLMKLLQFASTAVSNSVIDLINMTRLACFFQFCV